MRKGNHTVKYSATVPEGASRETKAEIVKQNPTIFSSKRTIAEKNSDGSTTYSVEALGKKL